MAVICASCLTPSRDGAKFCKSCGSRLAAVAGTAPSAVMAANYAGNSGPEMPTASAVEGLAGSAASLVAPGASLVAPNASLVAPGASLVAPNASLVAPGASHERSTSDNLADSPHRAVSVRPAAAALPGSASTASPPRSTAASSSVPTAPAAAPINAESIAPPAGPASFANPVAPRPVDRPVRSTKAEAVRPDLSTDEWPVTELLLSDPVPLEPTARALDSRPAFEPTDSPRPPAPAKAAREIRSNPKRVGASKTPSSAWPRIGAIAAVLIVVGAATYLFNTKDEAPGRPPSAPIAIAPPIEPAAAPVTAPVAARVEGPASPPPLLQGAALPAATPTPPGREAVAVRDAGAPFLPGPPSSPRAELQAGATSADASTAKTASGKPSAATARKSRKTPPAAPSTAEAAPPPAAQPVQVSLPAVPAEPPAPVDPTVACAGRGFFARSRCLVDQCAQAASRSHAQCEAVRQQQQIDEEKRNPSLAG